MKTQSHALSGLASSHFHENAYFNMINRTFARKVGLGSGKKSISDTNYTQLHRSITSVISEHSARIIRPFDRNGLQFDTIISQRIRPLFTRGPAKKKKIHLGIFSSPLRDWYAFVPGARLVTSPSNYSYFLLLPL